MTWLKNTNATVLDVLCAGPSDMKDKRLNDLPIPPGGCISTGTHAGTAEREEYGTVEKRKINENQ